MPDDRVPISDFSTPVSLTNNDIVPVVQEVNGVLTTLKSPLTQIGSQLNKEMQYASDLHTTNKTIIGAINEVAQGGGGGGSSTLAGLTDVTITTPTDGQALVYDSATNKWVNGAGGGGNANIWEGTQAQYDAIVNKDPDTVYFITDTNGDGQQFQPVVYSTDEREIGVWTDGRPLYQKTIDFGALPNNSSKMVNHNISNLDITAIAALEIVAEQGTYATFPRVHDSLINQQVFFEITATQIGCYSRNTDSSGFNGHITIRYCKTTDTAGSGQWTPQGVPAVHYSTDEQIVGTWINGETIYEKVVSGTTSSSPTTLITGVDKIIDVCGYADRYPVPMLQLDDNRKFISVVGSSGNAILSVSGSQYVGLNYDIAIRYTKSSS